MKTIAYSSAARREFRKLPDVARAALKAALDLYAATGEGDTKKLAGRPGVRLRSGDYRAIFVETADAIEIVAIGSRREIYR